jgi:hypothetical protein
MDVVDDVLDIAESIDALRLKLHFQEVFKSALGSFNLGAQDRFATDVHGNKEVWIGDDLHDAVQATQRNIRARKEPQKIIVKFEPRVGRKRIRNKRLVAARLRYEATGSFTV